ncbi:hypothetical protein BP00DRAFT_148838 [Aspergillus indologenus CBS 114.80]|uniref:Uncharacterized protein n=1 Tax=Aspergillus indologenus CBS 114.80 TaxID=1450541 RepID=A0A2V5I7H3_9EURO|nr:hypothetical protein BP00DRAFT_148838 [Aspergillus indologenus CBS 114.80]
MSPLHPEAEELIRQAEYTMIEALKYGLPNMKFFIVRPFVYHEYLRQWNQPIPPREFDSMIVLDFEGLHPRLTMPDVVDQVRFHSGSTAPVPYPFVLAVNGIVIKFVPGYTLLHAGQEAPRLNSIGGWGAAYPYAYLADLRRLHNGWQCLYNGVAISQ